MPSTKRNAPSREPYAGRRLPLYVATGSTRLIPHPPPPTATTDRERDNGWGFADSGFTIDSDGDALMVGGRYELAGQALPDLLPWMSNVLGIPMGKDAPAPSNDASAAPNGANSSANDKGGFQERSPNPAQTHMPVDPPVVHPEFMAQLRDTLAADQMTSDDVLRGRHGRGHTQREIYAARYGKMPRVPDLIVYPDNEAQVTAIVAAAAKHDVCLIPYGGGTSVTGALACPENEQRMIVSVAMARMNRIRWIDPVNRMACIEAGAVGRHIMTQLAHYGFTMGHEPDSVEFSTLGGWVATHASGMKKNRYGNIEDLLQDVTVITPSGKVCRDLDSGGLNPRESVGLDPRRFVLGSEGTLGIITAAVVKLFALPEVQEYGSALFPTFEKGVQFMYELTQQGSQGLVPASVRLVDNMQFQFGLALKPAAHGLATVKKRIEKLLVTKVKGFDPQKMVACTMVYEGGQAEVEAQKAAVKALTKRYGGFPAGEENGRRGYQLTFGIAYIRDFIMGQWALGESFETSVPWSNVLSLCDNVKRRIHEEHAARRLPGKPFVSCRVTQVYATGAAVYFYFGFHYKGVERADEVFEELEAAARDEILRSGGSLSHHHGIGKVRRQFLPKIMSETALAWNRDAKTAIDPQNIFGSGNQGLGLDTAQATPDSPIARKAPEARETPDATAASAATPAATKPTATPIVAPSTRATRSRTRTLGQKGGARAASRTRIVRPN